MASNETHTVKVFDTEIDQLRAVIAEMGGLAEAAISDAISALTQRDNAKAVRVIRQDKAIEPFSILPAMADVVSDMVSGALDAFAARDPEKAKAVCLRDPQVDDLYNSMFRALLTHMMENPHTITASTHLLFVAKSLERIGDHATNIAEMVYYAATGEQLAERPRGRDLAEATTEK